MKTQTKNTHSAFSRANMALRQQNYSEALELYNVARLENGELHELIDFNVKIISNRISTLPSTNKSAHNYALVIHAFHLDTLPDLEVYSKNFPQDADQYVTFPEDFENEKIDIIKETFPKAQLIPVPNIGQDIGALFNLMEKHNLSQYSFVCKIHTKKGNKKPDQWRQTLLKGVLGSKQQVQNTINLFQSNHHVKLAGAKQLYIYGPSNLWKNSQNIESIFGELVGDFNFNKNDWGFFAGTCFWISTDILGDIYKQMQKIEMKPATYTDDGTPAHAVERMFGLLPTIMGAKVVLNDVVKINDYTVESKTYPNDLAKNQISIVALLENLTPAAAPKTATIIEAQSTLKSIPQPAKLKIRGSLECVVDRAEIHGWVAAIGDQAPRTAILRFGSDTDTGTDITIEASTFRADLKAHNINEGKHAFSVTVPHAFMNGKKHKIFLIDSQTKTIISEKTSSWKQPKRSYVDFSGFLKSSMTQPMVNAPFTEEDKRSFAMMENIANRLHHKATESKNKPLVSVIMPTYNREKIISLAIQSVLSQHYTNLELIIIDDCSTDDSIKIIEQFNDSRIRLLRQTTNQGHSASRNKGLEAAQGKIVTYLDSDNLWDSRYIGATVGAFMSLPNANSIYSGQLLYRGESSTPFAARYGHFNRSLLENNNYIDLNAFAHRRELLSKIKGFDETLKRFVDYDLILKASEQGTMFSVPVLLSHYYYDKAENTVTNDSRHLVNMGVVRNRMSERLAIKQLKTAQQKLKRRVTIVIPNWESLEDIQECIDSIHAFEWYGMLSTIVIDNASSIEVKEYLRSEAEKSKITLIENTKNFGFTYAVNQGIESAQKDADILLLNNDAMIHGGAIQALQNACYKLKDAGMTVPRQILPKNTKTLRTHVPYANEMNDCDVNISAHHQNIAEISLFHDGSPLDLSYAAFFAVYIRRDVINDIGPLDAEYGRHYRSDRTYCDLMRNTLKRKLYYVPEAFVTHKLQKATDSLRDDNALMSEFELMFRRNQWDSSTSKELNFRKAAWDCFD
jgi:glycosyltransferase involved in cell wall biosynthesis